MKGIQVHVSVSSGGRPFYVSGKVEIPGLGVMEMHDCLSLETCECLMREIEAVAQQRLTGTLPKVPQGGSVKANPPPTKSRLVKDSGF